MVPQTRPRISQNLAHQITQNHVTKNSNNTVKTTTIHPASRPTRQDHSSRAPRKHLPEAPEAPDATAEPPIDPNRDGYRLGSQPALNPQAPPPAPKPAPLQNPKNTHTTTTSNHHFNPDPPHHFT